MKYSELRGLFRDVDQEDKFTLAYGGGKMGWGGRLNERTRPETEELAKELFLEACDNLTLPLEFIT